MSALGRCCRKSRKSNEAKNLADVDFWTTPPLRCPVAPIRRSGVAFLRSEVVLHRYARIYPWRRTRRSRAPSNGPDAFFVAQFSAGYITNMFGFDLRQGQVLGFREGSR